MSDIASTLGAAFTGNQYLRKCSLIVYGNPPTPSGTGLPSPFPGAAQTPSGTGQAGNPIVISKASAAQNQPGIELGDLRIQFRVNAMDVGRPPTALIRVINLSDATAQQIQREFSGVTLQAGYENGNFGIIFQGTIIRVRKGRLSNIETFVDIEASNFDILFNYGFVNKTVLRGASSMQVGQAIADGANNSQAVQSQEAQVQKAQTGGFSFGYIDNSFNTGGTLPRGKVMFGLASTYMDKVTDTRGCYWSIGPDGKVNIKKYTGYLPNAPVVLNSQTGMIGIPEATEQGIEVECLLNPNIKVGQRIKLDNASINTTTNRSNIGFPAYGDFQFFANTSADGVYTAFVIEHEGDSRGEGPDWKTKIVALAAPVGSPVPYAP